jgi:hypothetical protein
MKLEAMYSGSEVVDEIYCETKCTGGMPLLGCIDGIPKPPFGEMAIVDSVSENKPGELYSAKEIFYKPGGEFLILGISNLLDKSAIDIDKKINHVLAEGTAVFIKGCKEPISVKMGLPTEKVSNTGIDIEWNTIDVSIALCPDENAEGEYFIYEGKIYKILKPSEKVDEQIRFRLKKCCDSIDFYEKSKLKQGFFNLA